MDIKKVKELREKTGLGIMACKKALSEANEDIEKAIDILRKKGIIKAANKSGRIAEQGIVHAYIHFNKQLGVLIELNCETDFVAKNKDFEDLAHGVAVHIGAVEPKYISKDDIPEEIINREKEVYKEQMIQQGKPENIIDKIVENKLQKFYEENCLLYQEYFGREDKIKVEDFLKENIAKFGENIVIRRFVLYKVGE